MSERLKPRLWSDFDGTAVALAKKTDPRNWSKYPLKGVPGYIDFLKGATSSGEVEFAGFVSRRPNVAPRRWATTRSIAKLGIDTHFAGDQKVVLTGSEADKGTFLVHESRYDTVGMLEDKPHQLGSVLIGAFREAALEPNAHHCPIVLGVVSHPKSDEYVNRLLHAFDDSDRPIYIREHEDGSYQIYPGLSHAPRIDVVPLQPYSQDAGVAFAHRLAQTA